MKSMQKYRRISPHSAWVYKMLHMPYFALCARAVLGMNRMRTGQHEYENPLIGGDQFSQSGMNFLSALALSCV